MTFSATVHRDGDTEVRVDVTGRVLDAGAVRLELLITDVIAAARPDTLLIDLRHATGLGVIGVCALLAGYVTAIDYGTSYRVLHDPGPVRHVLQDTGTIDVLADSDDLGALLLAVLRR